MGWMDEIPEDQVYQTYINHDMSGTKGYDADGVFEFGTDFLPEPREVHFDTTIRQQHLVDEGYSEEETEDGGGFSYTKTVDADWLAMEFILPSDEDVMEITFYPPRYIEGYIYETFENESFDESWSNSSAELPMFPGNIDVRASTSKIGNVTAGEDLLNVCSFNSGSLELSINLDYDNAGDKETVYFRHLPIPDVQLKDLWVAIHSNYFSWPDDPLLYGDMAIGNLYAKFRLALLAHATGYDSGGNPYTYTVGVGVHIPRAAMVRDGTIQPIADGYYATVDYFFDSDGFLHINPWISEWSSDFWAGLGDVYDASNLLDLVGSDGEHEPPFSGDGISDGTALIKHAMLIMSPYYRDWS